MYVNTQFGFVFLCSDSKTHSGKYIISLSKELKIIALNTRIGERATIVRNTATTTTAMMMMMTTNNNRREKSHRRQNRNIQIRHRRVNSGEPTDNTAQAVLFYHVEYRKKNREVHCGGDSVLRTHKHTYIQTYTHTHATHVKRARVGKRKLPQWAVLS